MGEVLGPEGIDALGSVTIRIEKDDNVYMGRGSDTDIIVASAKAYMNALNRLLAMEPDHLQTVGEAEAQSSV